MKPDRRAKNGACRAPAEAADKGGVNHGKENDTPPVY